MEAVSGVSALYRDGRDNVLALHEFKSRFDARFRELIFDVEEEVAVQAVRRGSGGGGSGAGGCVCGVPWMRDGPGSDIHTSPNLSVISTPHPTFQ